MTNKAFRIKSRPLRIIFIVFPLILIFALHFSKLFWTESNLLTDEKGRIIRIYDGDTFRISLNREEKRLRLLGVDAPEIGDPLEENDLWARLARRFSIYYLLEEPVKLTFEKERGDRYGRLLAYVWIKKDILFNELIIRHGLARYFETPSLRPVMKRRLEQAEIEARKEKRGIWQAEWPTPIKSDQASLYLGELKVVTFACGGTRVEKAYTLIYDQKRHFQVYISWDRRPLFSELEKIKPGDILSVLGLIENYRGQPQIALFYPKQLRVVSRS